jgi:hypothetical protein
MIDITYSAQQKRAKDMAKALFQIELTAFLSLAMSSFSLREKENVPKHEDILAIINEISKQRVETSVADLKLHGIDVNADDLEGTRSNLVLVVKQLLELE